MKHLYFTTLLLICCACTLGSFAQVRTKIFKDGIPSKMLSIDSRNIGETKVNAPSIFNSLLNKAPDDSYPLEYINKFAVPVAVNIDMLSQAKSQNKGDTLVYILKLNAADARNTSLRFGKFHLSEHAILSINSSFELTDSITASENSRSQIWATRVYQGSHLDIILRFPAAEKEQNSLVIEKINFGFKKFGHEYFGDEGASATCNINVVCPEATGWEEERNSVALIVADGSEACTGALIMNTANTNTPYLLTANHCLAAGNVEDWVFQFQYWSATCATNSGWTEDIQFNGCTLRANYAPTDFALLELDDTPSQCSGIFYSGWNRSSSTPSSSFALHHPAGDLMKFSHDDDALTSSSWGGTNNHWVTVFEDGTVQPGSSGSPLYDMYHRIVGQLHGDQNNMGNYCAQRRGEYGKFNLSWTGGGTNSTRLSNWLDPINSGTYSINTENISDLVPPLTISGPSYICSSGTYSISTSLPVSSWVVYPVGYATISGSGSSVTVTRTNVGTVSLEATVTHPCGDQSVISRTIDLSGPAVTAYGTQGSCSGSSQTWYLYANTPSNGSNWNWYVDYLGTGSSIYISSPSSSSTYVTVTGGGVVKMTYKDLCGVTRNGGGITVYSMCSSFSVSPNPARSSIQITLDEENKQSAAATAKSQETSAENMQLIRDKVPQKVQTIRFVKIISLDGKVIKQQRFNGDQLKQTQMDISGIPAGVYIIEISDGINSQSSKLMIQ
ncbi:hypothetical protein COR50_07610 [Chitinophaga caeni]|uniref:Secretion system C-terminal sorting domain-containing protein n=1 Tax=Chitinophaga caeni TaxID=2029983 RepID=A0A291QT61_9BACT|nr:T9SS type A sorting domain-containing protein [Chitinophaga caeni]ATL47062.1 hypothetical protein COR50_07610 [Chitinophaga caeni]